MRDQWSVVGIAHGLDALREGGVPPKLLIIDDGWQSTQLDEPLRPITETGAVKSENKVRASSLASPGQAPATTYLPEMGKGCDMESCAVSFPMPCRY